MIKIYAGSTRSNTTSQILADQARMILKKSWFSDLEILEICKRVSSEKYEQDSTRCIETLNTEKQESSNLTKNAEY